MPEYLIDIRTNLHPEEIEAYVQRVQRAMSTLAARSSAAGSTSGDLAGEARVVQAKAYATGIASAKAGTLDQQGLIKYNAALDATFGKTAQAVKTLNENWAGKGGVLLNQQDLDRRSGLLAKHATARAGDGGNIVDDVEERAAQKEAARLTKQRVSEEAIRLEAAQRGIVFAEESSAAEREAAVRVARRAEVEQVKVLAAERALAAESGIPELLAQQKVAQRELNELVNARVRQIEREKAEQAGTGGQGSFFQRAQAYFANRNRPESQQREATSFNTGGQFISQRLFQGGAYAIAGAALYTMVGNIRSLIDEGEKTQVMFGQLKAQLTEVGQADKFPEVRDHILDMAHASGIAADQVGALAGTMLGAFTDPQQAIEATNAGLALMQVSGLSLADVQNNLVAVMRTFGITGEQAMSKVDDQVNHLRDTFGTSQREIIDGVGNIAPLAQEMGLSFKEASTVIAGASAVSGRSATQTANEIGRALTQIEKQLPVITNVLNTPSTQGLLSSVEGHVASGQTGQVLIDLIRHWQELTKAQQNGILTAIGGRREFASLAAALGENQKIIAALDDTSDHSGVTAQRLAEYHRSLSYQLKQAGEAFRQLGVAILNSPLGQALALIVQGGGDVARWLGDFLGLLGRLNSALGGIPSQVLALVGAWLILRNVLSVEHLKSALDLLVQIGKHIGGKITGSGSQTSATQHTTAIEEGGATAASAMRTGVVEGGDLAAAAMRAAISEAAAAETAVVEELNGELSALATETRAATAEEVAAINEALASGFAAGATEIEAAAGQLVAAEQTIISELSAELSALGSTLETAAATEAEAAKLQLDAAATQATAAKLEVDAAATQVFAAETQVADQLGAAAKELGGFGSSFKLAAGDLGTSLAGFARAIGPLVAVYAGVKIGDAVGSALLDHAGAAPGTDQDIKAKATGGLLGIGKHTEVTNQDQIAKAYSSQFDKMTLEQVKAIAAQHHAGIHVPGTDLNASLNSAQTAARNVQINAARQYVGQSLGEGGNKEYTQSVIDALQKTGALSSNKADDLVKGINDNDAATYQKVTDLYNKRKGDPKFKQQIAASQQKAAQAQQDAKLIAGDGVKTAQDLQKEFESGQINFDALQAGLNKQLDVYKRMAADAGGEGNLPQQVQQQMDALQDQVSKNELDRADKLTKAQDTREQADAARKGRPDQIQAGLAKAQRDAADAVKHDDPEKAAQAYAEQQKAKEDQVQYDAALRKSKTDIQKARAQAHYDPVASAQADLDLANQDLDNAKDDAAKQEAQAAIIDRTFALQQAKDQLDKQRRANHAALLQARAAASYNPVASAQADLDQALGDLAANRDPNQIEALQAAVQDKRNSLLQTQVDQAHALNALLQDRDKGNAQQVAADAIATASADVNRIVAAGGSGTAAWADAQRTLIDAERQAVDAALASTDAVLSYDEALANAAGDHDRVANDELKKAQAAYDAAVRNYGAGSDQAKSAQIDIISKAADLAHTQVSTGQSNIDFQLQMNQISVQQAIAMEEQLLAVAKNKDDQQAILLKIYQLRQEAAKNLQFDIPSNININGLLYQARRLDQTAAAGQGYQDNRNVQVQYNVYSPQDNQAALSDLTNVLAGPPRTGAAPRTL